VGLLEPRGRPAEIHDRQRAVSEIKIQNGGLETVRRFLFSRINLFFEANLGVRQRKSPSPSLSVSNKDTKHL
jgi:hypothetical protein